MRRRAVLAAGGALLAAPALAQGWSPRGRPLTIIVPFAAGGTTDVGARVLAIALERELGTSIVVLNRAGATTQIGSTELARARPDGSTIGLMSLPSLSMTYLDPERRVPYRRESFTAIAHYIADANLLVVPGASRFRETRDFIEAARAEPGRLFVATGGLMSNTHLAGVALERAAEVRFSYVHFNGGAPVVTALLAGDVVAGINGIQTTIPHEREGRLRVLATMGEGHTSFFPNARTLGEQGYDVASPSSFALLGPAGMPPEVVAGLSGAIRNAIAQPELQRRLADLALSASYLDPAALDAYWAAFEARQRPLIELARRQD
jgi:tripartite-type tricarboxylate transporter receptor subunit TctC